MEHKTKNSTADPLALSGMGTTPDMWEMVSDCLNGEKLPDSVNEAIYALRDGKAEVVLLQKD